MPSERNQRKTNPLSSHYVESKSIKIDIKIVDSPRRKYSVFIGATVIANWANDPQNENYWISKEEWDEVGPDIMLKKCPNMLL